MRLLLLVAFIAIAGSALAIDDLGALDDPALQARYEKLTDELRCLVCQNQSIADSTAGLAADLRREVRAMLEAGDSDAQILQFMVERYGDFVRYRPAFNSKTVMLWIGPFVLLAIGLGVAAVIIFRRGRVQADTVPQG